MNTIQNHINNNIAIRQEIYLHNSGISGIFVEEKQTSTGIKIIIKVPDGREFFAPKNEFKITLR